MLLFFSLLFAAHAQTPSFTLPDIVVQSQRLDEAAADRGASTTILEHEDFNGAASASAILRAVPGLNVIQSGAPGQPTAVFVRGAPSEQTLVLLDGIELNDATGTARGFDFANLSLEGLERIEIYRGPEALRFGANAAGGVINLISRRGHGDLKAHGLAEGGSYNTHRVRAGVDGERGRLSYGFSAEELASDGFSAATGGREADGTRRLALASHFEWSTSATAGADFTYRGLFNRTDLDAGGGAAGDDPNYVSTMREHAVAAGVHGRALGDRLASSLRATHTLFRRSYDNEADPVHTTPYHEIFSGTSTGVETRHEYAFSGAHALEAAVQWKREQSGEGRNTQTGEALIYKALLGDFSLMTGARHDRAETGGGALTYSVAPAVRLGAFALRASAGSGFRVPSLYQLYSTFGNRDLNPEDTAATESSLEFHRGRLEASVTAFRNRYRNLIDFDFASSRYANIARARAEGFESRLAWAASPLAQLELTHTYLETRNERTGATLPRRPAHSGSASVRSEYGQFSSRIALRMIGRREDTDPVTFTATRLPQAEVVDAEAGWAFHPAARVFLRAENLFDKRYENAAGFAAEGVSVYAGLSGTID